MSRTPSETEIRGIIDGVTTHRNESPLARRFRTSAQLIALRDTGIKTSPLSSMLSKGDSRTVFSTETKPR